MCLNVFDVSRPHWGPFLYPWLPISTRSWFKAPFGPATAIPELEVRILYRKSLCLNAKKSRASCNSFPETNPAWWFGCHFFIYPYIGNLIILIDFHIFQSGGPGPPTRKAFTISCVTSDQFPRNVISFNAAISSCEKCGEWPLGAGLMVRKRAELCQICRTGHSSQIRHLRLALADVGHVSALKPPKSPIKKNFDAQLAEAAINHDQPRTQTLSLLEAMPSAAVQPNLISLNSTISSCEKATKWQRALGFFEVGGFFHRLSCDPLGNQWEPHRILQKRWNQWNWEHRVSPGAVVLRPPAGCHQFQRCHQLVWEGPATAQSLQRASKHGPCQVGTDTGDLFFEKWQQGGAPYLANLVYNSNI